MTLPKISLILAKNYFVELNMHKWKQNNCCSIKKNIKSNQAIKTRKINLAKKTFLTGTWFFFNNKHECSD